MNLTVGQKLLRFHWIAMLLMLSLSISGIFFIYSATHLSEMGLQHSARQQVIWLCIGLAAFFTLSLLDYEYLVQNGAFIFIGAVSVLIFVLAFGTEIKGAKSWIRFGGFSIQPAEFSKVAYVIGMTWFMLKMQDRIKDLLTLVILLAISIIPVGLILAQPDFGSASVYGPITYVMMVVAGIRKRYLFLPILAIFAGITFAYFSIYKAEWKGTVQDIPRATVDGIIEAAPLISLEEINNQQDTTQEQVDDEDKVITLLKPYQVNRIRTFFEPELDPLGAGWTIRQSLIAVGSGGWQGKGYLKGDQNIYGFLPQDIAYNDFIFAVVAEEFGFFGGTGIIVGLALLMLCIAQVASRAKNYGGCLLAAGIGGMFFAHYLVNIGMTIKVVPITGIPLPLLSYGGTFLVTCLAGLGIVQSVWIHRRDY
ncbi:MAG: rod shape-determining protein RodA [Verrucomicrobiota bacterium]